MALHDYDHIKHHDRIVRVYYDAIIDLVRENKIDDITVQMILDKTGTARGTFYKYFSDKYSLMNYVYYHDIKDNYVNHFNADTFVSSSEQIYVKHYEKKDYYKKLFLMTGQNNFFDWMKQFWIEAGQAVSYVKYGGFVSNVQYYSTLAFSLGLSEITKKWILSDCKDLTPAEMAIVCGKNLVSDSDIFFVDDKEIASNALNTNI